MNTEDLVGWVCISFIMGCVLVAFGAKLAGL